MKKSLPYISLLVAVALFNGCGGSTAAENVDNTAPLLSSDKYVYENVLEGTNVPVTLISDDLEADFFESSSSADIQGSTLTFTAPTFIVGNSNSYTVEVTAKDKVGNESAVKEFTFTVIEANNGTYEADASIVVAIGDKTFTSDGSYLVGPTGLLWEDLDTPLMTYNAASSYCIGKGFRLPTRFELLNLIDYTNNDGVNTIILDDNLQFPRGTSWAALENSNYFAVNNVTGADVNVSMSEEHRVRCVKGTIASMHTFTIDDTNNSIVHDTTTGLDWTKIEATSRSHGNAQLYCSSLSGSWSLPTINELRSIMDETTNTIPESIASLAIPITRIWSSTQYLNDSSTQYYTLIKDYDNRDTSVLSEGLSFTDMNNIEQNITLFVTCTKR